MEVILGMDYPRNLITNERLYIMLDDNTKEKLFILLFIVIIALSFIMHIPEYIEVWNSN